MNKNDYDKKFIQTMFANTPDFELDLYNIFDTHFSSIDTSDVGSGNEIFSLTSKLARLILHSCKHEVPTEKQLDRVLRLKAHYDFHGAKMSWTGKPIVINNKTRCIEDGIKRLYAVALMSKHGIYSPMLLKEG